MLTLTRDLIYKTLSYSVSAVQGTSKDSLDTTTRSIRWCAPDYFRRNTLEAGCPRSVFHKQAIHFRVVRNSVGREHNSLLLCWDNC